MYQFLLEIKDLRLNKIAIVNTLLLNFEEIISWQVKFSFSKKATKIAYLYLMVLPSFDIYSVNIKTIKKIVQIFVAFSEKLNFTKVGSK